MSTANTKVMIDALLVRYGLSETDAGGRADCLKWVQLAEEEVWSAGPWWFKQVRMDVAMSEGTTVYTLSVANGRVHALEQGGGGDMTRLDPDAFRALYGGDSSSGYPEIWTPLEPSTTNYMQVAVWPVPTGVETLKAVYDRGVTTLEDLVGSVSGVPSAWRHLVLLRAEVYASLHLGQAGQAEGYMGRFTEGLAALEEYNNEHYMRR